MLSSKTPSRLSDGRIRLLMVISDLSGGGAERQTSILLRHLPRERFELHLCIWRENFAYEIPSDVVVHHVEKTRPWHVVSAVLGTQRLIDRLRPDLVYSQLHYVNMVTGSALALSRHRPAWICRQCNDPRREMRGPFAAWARWTLRRADRVVGLSEGVSRATVQHLRLDPRRVVTVYNVADRTEIDRRAAEPLLDVHTSGKFVVVHAGRLHPQKNQAMLLRAFSRLRGRPAELWILGQGPLDAELKALASELKLEHQVKWLGFKSNPFAYFRAADCFALSSDYEGLGNVLIEAMLCGTAVVSTRCPYGPDELIVDGSNGYLVPVGDTAALGAALERLAADPELVADLGATARQRAIDRFDVASAGSRFDELFEGVLRERRG